MKVKNFISGSFDMNKSMTEGVLDLANEEIITVDEDTEVYNSFFEMRYHGSKVLILAPHPDDEINIAGNMILNLTRARAKVFVAYTTNGDFDTKASIRAHEAANSLKILGVKRENVIFLGYGDTYNGTGKPHIFFATEPVTSPAGHVETYPADEFKDYAFTKRGEHSQYTRKNFLRDLKDLILDIEADVIFCVDFDKHADHRMLSLSFEQVIAEILSRPLNKYKPEIYKKFAYATAFTAERDFYAPNLLETKQPSMSNKSYDFDFIDHVNYSWKDRIRFPVAEDCRLPLLEKNPVARAIFSHVSQRNEWNSLGILNSDEIFFERRTDSLTYSAQLKATSGNAQRIRDFQYLNTNDIDAPPPTFKKYFWKPESDDESKTLSLTWPQLQQIAQIRIYGNLLSENVDKIEIKLDNVYVSQAELPAHGQPLVIDFDENIFVAHAEFKVIEAQKNFGISEIEIFNEREPQRIIKPFIKITVDDNFIYDYIVPRSVKRLTLKVYTFHIDRPVELATSDGAIYHSEDKFILQFDKDIVTVRAEVVDDPEIFDQVKIRRVSQLYLWRLKAKQILERIYIHLRRKFKFLRR